MYFDRYLGGDHLAVWRELINLGDAVLEEPLRSDALRVCEEVVRRARVNLQTLHCRLLNLGYEFAEPAVALVDAGADAVRQVDEFEREVGAIPLVARVWYQAFQSVDFSQADSQRACRDTITPPPAPDVFGLGSHLVLIFQSLTRAREQLMVLSAEYKERLEQVPNQEEYGLSEEYGNYLLSGGWASNCEPKGFVLPARGIDAVFYNDGGGDTYFVDQLRKAFEWGGFPFWQWSLKKRKFYSPCEYKPNFARLLPILKEGLLPL